LFLWSFPAIIDGNVNDMTAFSSLFLSTRSAPTAILYSAIVLKERQGLHHTPSDFVSASLDRKTISRIPVALSASVVTGSPTAILFVSRSFFSLSETGKWQLHNRYFRCFVLRPIYAF